MPDAAVGLVDHFDHARLDQGSGVLEPSLVKLGGDFDRLAPQKEAAPERQCDMEMVPAGENPPPAGGIGDRHDRHLGQPRGIDDADADAHRRAARPIRSDRHTVPFL